MSRFVEIALPLPLKELFTYKIPDNSYYNDIIGKRAFVPFGKQFLTGVIVRVSNQEIDQEIKPIIEIIDEKRIFSDKMLEFTKWISDYYLCSWGEVLKAAMPPNFNLEYIKKIIIEREPTPFEVDELRMKAPKRARLLETIIKRNGDITISQLQRDLDLSNISPQIEALVQKGFISIHGEWEKQIEVKVAAAKIRIGLLDDENELTNVFDKIEKSAPKQAQILSYILIESQEGREFVPFTEILKKFKTTHSSIKALKDKGLIEIMQVTRQNENNSEINLAEDEKSILLSDEQLNVYREIYDDFNSIKYSGHLLYGVTGSGKTLIYVKLIEEILKKGQQVLYLLPEISLTPQIVDRISNFFGDKVAVLHSKMNDNERNKIFSTIQSGKYQVVLGVRSAVFAPLDNLGLIIVDEEHDASYKQNHPAPRYNAKDSAIVRAKLENIPIVLGSATPSLESVYNCEIGNLKLHTLSKRFDGAELPIVKVMDMRSEKKTKRVIKSFSEELIHKIIERLKKNEGIILFQNRRGFAPQLYCPDCGNVPMCKNCDIALTYHKKADKLVCHYCGYIIPSMQICNVCGSGEIEEIGAGTEKIEEELREILKDRGYTAKIARFDKDSTTKKDSSRRIIYGFINGDIDILVGTQMLTKGIDIGRVTLVGIINADQHLFFPDFRSNERTFQIITQVSGRAGRKGSAKGEVIIQTSNPEAYAIELSSKNDFEQFTKVELQIRKQLNYPPFCRLSKIEFSGNEFETVRNAAFDFYSLLPKNVPGLIYIGPVSPSIVRINSQYRQLLFIKSSKIKDRSNKLLEKILLDTFEKFNKKYKQNIIKVIIDIDSFQNM